MSRAADDLRCRAAHWAKLAGKKAVARLLDVGALIWLVLFIVPVAESKLLSRNEKRALGMHLRPPFVALRQCSSCSVAAETGFLRLLP